MSYLNSGKTIEIECNQLGLVSKFKFDLLPKGQLRSFWVHKNESNNDYGPEESYAQPVIPVCIDDKIKLSFNLFNRDFLDYGEMHLQPKGVVSFDIKVQKLPDSFAHFDRGTYFKPDIKKLENNLLARIELKQFFKQPYYSIDLERHCEMEERVHEWFELSIANVEHREQTLKTFGFEDLTDCNEDFNFIITHFDQVVTLDKMEVGGNDIRVLKLYLSALSPGHKYYSLIDTDIEVLTQNQATINEVKRSGLIMDIEKKPVFQVRAHD